MSFRFFVVGLVELSLGLFASGRPAHADAFTFQAGHYTLYYDTITFSGINDAGQIVGYRSDGSGGFLLENGVFTPVTGPGLYPLGIDNAGRILAVTGNFDAAYLLVSGALTRLPEVPFAVPGSTGYQALNSAGQFVGDYCLPPNCSQSGGRSFLYSGGTFSTLSVPGSFQTFVYGINDAGQIAGGYTSPTGRHGFVLTAGQYATVDVPGLSDTFLTAISSSGYVAGINMSAPGHPNTTGFVEINGVFTTVEPPNALSTDVLGINSSGTAVGFFLPVATVPEPGSLALLCCGIAALMKRCRW